MCYIVYTPAFEDEIHTCHTEVQGRPALIVRTNRVQTPTRPDSLEGDEFLRKEIGEGFLKEMEFEMGPEEWETFHCLEIRTENKPLVWTH